ncbi:hypothetical protein E3N88_03990 [Mikania micrantha]|uniref:Uncharacterized protein n=1 Tax=Mikania micrantha TaxID=192012 RepID=A0A5N6PTN4_9ASTR|nr:hypothetical protein E3N88_03990 [Mikania micrantha]
MITWSELPPEILNTVAGKLHFYEDHINFLCVCTSWKSSSTTTIKNSIQHLPSRLPMLMLSESNTNEDESHQDRRFFLLSNGGTMRKLPLLEAHRQRCISSHGWLLTTGEQEFHTKLVNPLSAAQIDLPELYMFKELQFDQDEWVYYGSSMRKVVLTSSNPLDPSFRVIIVWGKTIGFCQPGDASWARINGWKGGLFDITYHSLQKRLYIVTTMGIIYECDIINDVSSPLTLSLVTTFPAKETSRFQCHVFGLDDGKWSKLTSLGDKAVFIGFNSSFSVIGDGEGVKPNCIYYTDDLYEPNRGLPDGGGGDVGIYHMSNGVCNPGQCLISGALGDEEIRGSVASLWSQLGSLLPKINQRWTSAPAVHDKSRTKLSILSNKLSQLQRDLQTMEKEREEEKIHSLEIERLFTENEIFLNKEISMAKKDSEHGLALLEKSRAALNEDSQKFLTEKKELSLALKKRVFAIKSCKLNLTLSVQKAAHEYGVNLGLKSGHRHSSAGHALENPPNYQPRAKIRFREAAASFESMTFPYLGIVTQCVKEPLSVLQGLLPENFDAGDPLAFGG